MAVISLEERDNLAAVYCMTCRLERSLDTLRTTGAEDGVRHVRCHTNQLLGVGLPRDIRAQAVAPVEAVERRLQRRHELRIAMAKVVGAAIDVRVDETPRRRVVEDVALPVIDHEANPRIPPELHLAGVPRGSGPLVEAPF